MKKVQESIEDFDNIFIPFKYKDTLIFSKTLGNTPGFYGTERNMVVFYAKEDIEDTFEIEVVESNEELVDYVMVVDLALQRIAMNEGVLVKGYPHDISTTNLIKPLVKFVTNYEKNVQRIEGIRNGII